MLTGGMSNGFIKNGFDIKWAIDNDPCAVATFMLNHQHVVMFDEDAKQVLEKIKLANQKGDDNSSYKIKMMDILWASPPCQAFSSVNTSGGKNDQVNLSMTYVFTDYVKHFKPPVVAMESK